MVTMTLYLTIYLCESAWSHMYGKIRRNVPSLRRFKLREIHIARLEEHGSERNVK